MRCESLGCTSIKWASVAVVTLHEFASFLKQAVVPRAALGGSGFGVQPQDFTALFSPVLFEFSLILYMYLSFSIFNHFLAFGGEAVPVVGHSQEGHVHCYHYHRRSNEATTASALLILAGSDLVVCI